MPEPATISPARQAEVVDAVRRGTVPSAGLDLFAVGMERFVAKLKEIGYRNPLNIEREGVPDHQQKLRDIKMGVGLLERLLA